MPAAPHDDPLYGRLVDGRYQVGERIARGGMATVYVATDLRLDRRIAIKVMHPHLADDDQFRERFIQEARQAARLAHPNVVNVLDQGEEPGLAYLAMEHVPSITLRDLLLERGRLRPEQSLQVLEAVLAGLAAAHRAGIVHRDIKPENVLLAHDGRIKIADFGLARAATANTATGKALLGTIAYLSPELVTRGVADARSDIYAVGIMLFEMLTGKQPYTGEQPLQIAYQHAHEQVPSPSSLEPSVPRELDLLVHWATHRDPNLRPADASEMLDEVQRIRAGERSGTSAHTRMLPVTAAAPSDAATAIVDAPAATPPRRGGLGTGDLPALDTGDVPPAARALQRKAVARRRRGFVLLALVLVLALLAAGAGWWFNDGPGGRTTVPEIAQGTSEVDARAALEEAGLVVADEVQREHSPDVLVDTLIRTDPGPGAELQRGGVVTLVLSLGVEMLPAPQLAGVAEQDAAATLEAAGFVATSTIDVFSDQPSGTVVAAWADGGADASTQETWPRGTAFHPVVSRGPQPSLVGLDQANAQMVLQAVGLTLGAVSTEPSREVAEGQIIRASYPDGAQYGSGAPVAIVVSSGPPQVQIPADILERSIPDAVAALEALGFDVSLDTNVPGPLQGVARPTAVSPEPGATVDEGSAVTVTAQY
ncbi:Stk1 family PASTA domain-containing Ser/Thr kinase [Agrococcus sp. SGAir0287]|uniref:Stk1 family PASTA domain-containing Ser/Thr kinase n=1 Tax=Agrococcus sp. SGAir0287 TaxID=2070347 RepID=UPI0020C77D9A|nr:Stk1 family PASTA domain-containing Ser/Thr kinase [Agrococcus sp. SGAir0287]